VENGLSKASFYFYFLTFSRVSPFINVYNFQGGGNDLLKRGDDFSRKLYTAPPL